MFEASIIVRSGGWNEDRVELHQGEDRLLVALTDGPGGTAGRARAADFVCARVCSLGTPESVDWSKLLQEFDRQIKDSPEAGECSAVVAEVSGRPIRGATVGHLGVWLTSLGGNSDLTRSQSRKPLIGSGDPAAQSFGPIQFTERLLVASDGLRKHVSRDQIATFALKEPLSAAVAALVRAAELSNCKLQDDVALVLCDGRDNGSSETHQRKTEPVHRAGDSLV